jgi:hypothetical protein
MPGCRWLTRQSGQGQLRHIGHIGIGGMTPTALCEHGGDPRFSTGNVRAIPITVVS